MHGSVVRVVVHVLEVVILAGSSLQVLVVGEQRRVLIAAVGVGPFPEKTTKQPIVRELALTAGRISAP